MKNLTYFQYVLFLFILFFKTSSLHARNALPASRFEYLSGLKTEKSDKILWDKKFNTVSYIYGKAPVKFLAENVHYIPAKSKILDMGMGEGRNAVFLAQKGHKVTGIDISSVAIRKANMLADEFAVQIKTIVASLKEYEFKENEFDAIICFFYVDRTLHEKIEKWLRPGGVLIYGTFTKEQLKVKNFDKSQYNDETFLNSGELITLFPSMKLIKYEEPVNLDFYETHAIWKKNKK